MLRGYPKNVDSLTEYHFGQHLYIFLDIKNGDIQGNILIFKSQNYEVQSHNIKKDKKN